MNPRFLLKLHLLTALWFDELRGPIKFSWTHDEHEIGALACVTELEKADLIVVADIDRTMGTMRGHLTELGRNYVLAISHMATIFGELR